MYTLYYYPRNASLAPHFLLEKLAVEYQLELVDRKSNGQKSSQYLTLNPAGRIPTLVDDGLVLFESAAICMHLCDQNPQANLLPAVGHKDRSLCYQWLMYLSNTVQAELMVYIYPQKHTTNEDSAQFIVEAQENRIIDMFVLLDEQIGNNDFLVGNSLSACDYYLFMLSIWSVGLKTPPLGFSNLGRFLRNMAKRPEVIQVCKKEKINLQRYS